MTEQDRRKTTDDLLARIDDVVSGHEHQQHPVTTFNGLLIGSTCAELHLLDSATEAQARELYEHERDRAAGRGGPWIASQGARIYVGPPGAGPDEMREVGVTAAPVLHRTDDDRDLEPIQLGDRLTWEASYDFVVDEDGYRLLTGQPRPSLWRRVLAWLRR